MTGKLHYLGWGSAGENQAILTSLEFLIILGLVWESKNALCVG